MSSPKNVSKINDYVYKNITFALNTSCKSIGMEFLTQ